MAEQEPNDKPSWWYEGITAEEIKKWQDWEASQETPVVDPVLQVGREEKAKAARADKVAGWKKDLGVDAEKMGRDWDKTHGRDRRDTDV